MKTIYRGLVGGIVGVIAIALLIMLVFPDFSNDMTNRINSLKPTQGIGCKILGDQIEELGKRWMELDSKRPIGTADLTQEEAAALMQERIEYNKKNGAELTRIHNDLGVKLAQYKNRGCDFGRFVDYMTDFYGMPLDEETKNQLKSRSP